MTLYTYLPQDRVRALARGETLPDRTTGSALFADISGFTALTEALRNLLGARRGGEELTYHLNNVYTALIDEVEHFGGSVLSFAGDAITCWFDDAHETAVPRAVRCAFALQQAIQPLAIISLPNDSTTDLNLKVAVATGSARRFLVGDPAIHYLDALAGTTVERTAVAEHLATQGEILLDETTAQILGDTLTIQEWRTDPDSGQRFAVVSQFTPTPEQLTLNSENWSLNPENRPLSTDLRPFLLPTVYERELAGQASFLTEFRPCTVLFVHFEGIDYETDDAQSQLDAFIRTLQARAERYEGTILQLTIGDKGSYAYLNFGALTAHEDDVRRAVKTALTLQIHTSLQLQIGITYGLMRVGTYGGKTRQTYGALGDDVNLAARLMTTAAPGEVLLSGQAHKAVQNEFTFEPHPPLSMKGKAEPLPVFILTGARQRRAVRLQEPTYALPMVGREHELTIINERLAQTLAGQSQVIGIVAEAGMGKSRLVAEVIRNARRLGFVGYGGACQADSIHTPYLVWKAIWQAFFDVDPEMPLRRLTRWLEGEIEDRAPARVEALPLLSPVLDVSIPDNEFTQALEPKIRQSALHALLEDCLKVAAREEPVLIILEDLHWIDAISHDLLEQLARAVASYPVCFVLAYRPPQLARLQAPHLEALPQFTRIELHELTQTEAEQAIRAKLAQLYPARRGAVPTQLVEMLMARAQGNPFFLEELLNYLRDRGLDPRDPADIEKIELPNSLHTLILSRIDQLSEQEKGILRVASIIGRLFRAHWLTGYYPELGAPPQVKATLKTLESLDITPLDSPEPELAYLFKHIVTHEVTYESLPFATRAKLHEQLARYLEHTYPEALPLEALAFHYGRSENKEKQREYLHKAGEAAQMNFANDAALGYYEELLPLLKDGKEKEEIHLQHGGVLQRMGKWDEAEADYRAVLEMAENDAMMKANAQYALGKLYSLRGDYETALTWLALVRSGYEALGKAMELGQVLTETGQVFFRKGEYAQAHEILHESLGLATQTGDQPGKGEALNILGQIHYLQGDYASAQTLFEESLALWRTLGGKLGISLTLNNLGAVAWAQSDYTMARSLWEESLVLKREIGDKWGISSSLNNLGNIALAQGDYTLAQSQFEESLNLDREMGNKWGVALLFHNLGLVAMASGDIPTALTLLEESLVLRREMGEKWGIAMTLVELGNVAIVEGNYTTARALFEESLAMSEEMDDKPIKAYALLGMGLANMMQTESIAIPEVYQQIADSIRLRQEMGEQLPLTSSLIGIASLTLHIGDARHAAKLLGAVQSALEALHAALEPEMIHYHRQTLAAVQEALGEPAFQAAWEEGAQWSLEKAVALALAKFG